MKNLFYCGIKVILRSLSNDQATMASTVTSSQLLLGSETLRCLHECFELQKSCLVFHMVIRIYSNSRITSVSASESFISDSPLPPPSPTCRNYCPLLFGQGVQRDQMVFIVSSSEKFFLRSLEEVFS